MGKKYIIEKDDNESIWSIYADADGDATIEGVSLTPYTEPDMEQVRKEAYQQGHKDGYNKHDTERIRKQGYDKGLDDIGNALRLLLFQYSNYTLQEIFGYDTARAVVEHFEGSEIVARIRCYEGGVKQDVETIRKEAYEKGYETAKHECEDCTKNVDLNAIRKEAYEQGRKDGKIEGQAETWVCVKKIALHPEEGGIALGDIRKIFGCNHFQTVFRDYSASECIEKIRAYEQEKEEQITKGDIVLIKSTPEVEILATYADEEYVSGIALTEVDGNCEIGDQYTNIRISNVEKTGKHYDIVSVLQKMREESNG